MQGSVHQSHDPAITLSFIKVFKFKFVTQTKAPQERGLIVEHCF